MSFEKWANELADHIHKVKDNHTQTPSNKEHPVIKGQTLQNMAFARKKFVQCTFIACHFEDCEFVQCLIKESNGTNCSFEESVQDRNCSFA